MKTRPMTVLLSCGVLTAVAGLSVASTNSPIQSSWRPLGYAITAKVQLANSDSGCALFESNKTTYKNYCTTMLPEGKAFTGVGLNQLDPTRLYFFFDYAPRVYFLAEGACYDNALGVTIATVSAPVSTPVTGANSTVFPNTHSSIGTVCTTNSGTRTSTEPLLMGDFVQFPTVTAGQQLAFFLMAQMNSSHSPAHVYYNGSAYNSDAYQHLIAFFPDNSQFIIIGWEDMYNGGDKDCNDLLFVVDIGPNNAAALRNQLTLPK